MTSDVAAAELADTAAVAGRKEAKTSAVDAELVGKPVEQARAGGMQLSGEGGLLQQLTKMVVESALEGEITDHLGYDHGDPAGRGTGNSRNGTRSETVVTDVGPVDIDVPRDRAASIEPQIVRKRQRRLNGVENMVLSLSAKGLTHGEISAHLREVYGAEVSKQTISTITDKVIDGMAEWCNRPLDSVYPVIFLDAIHVKIWENSWSEFVPFLAFDTPTAAAAVSMISPLRIHAQNERWTSTDIAGRPNTKPLVMMGVALTS